MKTDSFYYELLSLKPEAVNDLLQNPELKAGKYKPLVAPELKGTSKRIDGWMEPAEKGGKGLIIEFYTYRHQGPYRDILTKAVLLQDQQARDRNRRVARLSRDLAKARKAVRRDEAQIYTLQEALDLALAEPESTDLAMVLVFDTRSHDPGPEGLSAPFNCATFERIYLDEIPETDALALMLFKLTASKTAVTEDIQTVERFVEIVRVLEPEMEPETKDFWQKMLIFALDQKYKTDTKNKTEIMEKLRDVIQGSRFEELPLVKNLQKMYFAEGEAKGRAEGEAKGRAEGEALIIRNLSSRGLSPKEISEWTNIPLSEVLTLLGDQT